MKNPDSSTSNGLKDRPFHERHRFATWLENLRRKRKFKGQKASKDKKLAKK